MGIVEVLKQANKELYMKYEKPQIRDQINKVKERRPEEYIVFFERKTFS